MAPRHHLRVVVSQPAFLRRLASYVRRAVPAQDVDDVTQSVLSDALAAEAVPDSPEDMARWIRGIARHKVADFHRVAHRHAAVEAVEAWSPPPPVEARSVLGWLARQVEGRPRDEESLDWLVREGAGERLDAVAHEAKQSPANVRQRVCRLRSTFRKRWLAEIAVAVALACLLIAVQQADRWNADAIAPELSSTDAASTALLSQLDGSWHVVALRPDADLDPARQSLAQVAPRAISVRVEGNLLSVVGPVATARRTMTVTPGGDGAFELTFRDDKGGEQTARATLDHEGKLTLVSRAGAWRGTAVLSR